MSHHLTVSKPEQSIRGIQYEGLEPQKGTSKNNTRSSIFRGAIFVLVLFVFAFIARFLINKGFLSSRDGKNVTSSVLKCRQEPICDSNAACSEDQQNCVCKEGFQGGGLSCADIDECIPETHNCSEHAICTNLFGSHNCSCLTGFHGDGWSCKDVDECKTSSTNCSDRAFCNNTVGSYNCLCLEGFQGDGMSCQDIDECSANIHSCSAYAY